MLILYVAAKYDYGAPERGYSFEHWNFFDSLRNMGHDLLYFDFMTLLKTHGRDGMNHRLQETVASERPDLMFVCLFRDELDKGVIRSISDGGATPTLNWFCDDHWRFDDFSRYWAPCFNWVVTTASSAEPKYAEMGHPGVIKSQWACNHFLYRKLDLPLKYDVVFVGQAYGQRPQLIETLRRQGVDARAWGHGWQAGRLSQPQMIEVFNQSRINLNFSNSWTPAEAPRRLSRRRRLAARTAAAIKRLAAARSSPRRAAPPRGATHSAAASGAGSATAPPRDQIKGRNFEVPGCGGFLLTGQADNLEDYYDIGREVACYADAEEMTRLVRHYLSNEQARAAAAENGFQRTLREHTYAHRFWEIFRQMKLPCPAAEKLAAAPVAPGAVQEVY